MPLPSSGIIVVEKPSSAPITKINNSTTINTVNSSIHPPQEQAEQQSQIKYYEYYDVKKNQLSQQQQQYHHQQQQQHSTIVVDDSIFHQQQQQQLQLGGSSVVSIGRKIHSSLSTSSSSSSTSSASSLCSPSPTLLNKSNLQIQTLKTVPMPQTKQYSQQQQIIQHTSHSTTVTAATSNTQHHLHQHPHHVQQIGLAASSSIHHQSHQHHQQQQPAPSTHMIQVSEEFLGQTANNHTTGNMMISTTGEVINQQQIFKIVSTDGTTGNMIIDATNQNANSTTTTSKVLLSNLRVLSKQQTTAQGQIIGNSHQQPQTAGQTINFVNAKNLYTTSTAGGNILGGGKQQKFTVATANVSNYKSSATKQGSTTANTQYIQQSNSIGQQKINMTAGNRNMQMLTTTRLQNAASCSSGSNLANNNSVAVLSNNSAPAQTMVLQQPQKFIANNTAGSKMTNATLGAGGNIIKKTTTTGTLRMNNSHNAAAATKLMNNLQTTQGVKTFITQSPCVQPQTQQNMNQLTVQHHTTKSGSKSKFVKQYNNAILNSAGAVAIATLPHQQSSSQNNVQIQQQHQQLQPQTTYINHHKSAVGSTKINKINSKYAQSVNMTAQLPPGTQLHQKSINQTQQQQQQQQHFQTTSTNSNIKFVNAQGTVIQQQQQILTPQKINKHHHQQQYQNLQNFDTVDGNHLFNQTNANQSAVGATSSISSGTTTLPSAASTGSSLLTDDIMMVNGTQMTDELSARILQSMSQKSFSNQRYQQQQQHVFQTKTSTATTTQVSNSINTNNCNSNNTMLPPPPCTTQNTIMQTNNNSNILLSPREYTLYSATASASTVGIVPANHYNNSANPTATASSNIMTGSFSSNNYITVSNNIPNIATHTSGTAAANSVLCSNTSGMSTNNGRQAQSAPSSRSQSMERKLHESSMSRKSTEYYKVQIKDYHSGCAFVVPKTATIYEANTTSPSATSLIDFIIPLPSCTTITTTNNITTSIGNCTTMTTIITNSSHKHNLNQININSNHNSQRGSSSHHNNLGNATAAVAQSGGSLGNMSSSLSNLMGGVAASTPPSPSPLPIPRPPSIPPAALIMEPQAQVIHLQATKSLPGANNCSNDDDDDIIGEEVRPAPVDTEDIRLRILHAVLFDHTYVNPIPSVLPTSFDVQLPLSTTTSAAALISTAPTCITAASSHVQQWSLGGIGAIAAAGPGGVAQKSYTIYGTQLSRLHQDDDSYTALSNTSRLAVGDIDPGEETETAPEAELEDDSVTRCICDLTHDDGYMICCDKCCAWQHVDCMGIDRQNIPDEYLCELCQPRIVDKARARSLQLMKRKEQQQQLLLSAQAQATASTNTMGSAGSANGGSMSGVTNLMSNDLLGGQQRLASSSGGGFLLTGNISVDSAALQLLAAGGSNLKKNKILKKVKDGVSGKRSKKSEKLATAAAAGFPPSGKPARKETKKNTKRKKVGSHDGGISTVGMTAVEKHAANLRQWIENYELAVTNHYSPELRARLHAITKQPSLLQSILNTENPILKQFSNGSLVNRATTVPHAGGKILISNLDIVPNSPICELRGKYMLTTQYKTQNTSMNMNSPPPNNYHLASYKAHKTPGPFIFFYQLLGTEAAASSQLVPQATTTTMLNPDGTYTTTTTTLPAQQSPLTFLKGPEICVDTRTYGNEARFVRRSCRPNAEIQHLFEKGTIHLFIVALTDIRASTEITIRHEPHDLLAVENRKSFSIMIQPTSTPCACGLTKDCIFGPPIPQLPPVAKSNAGRKSLAHSGGGSCNAGNLTAKQRKTNQQNLNRNRSISSSASGDSNMGVAATSNTVAISLNSPNNVGKMPAANKIVNNNTLNPLTASCNSNLSNASSTSSTLTSIMHDSGVCTSSPSPSVSIPSPTLHMHSPIQQQQQAHQQQLQQQLLHSAQIKSTVQLLPQQQQQQLMQSLPTPLVLTSPNMINQHQRHQKQQQPVIQQSTMIIQPHQPLNVLPQAVTSPKSVQDVNATTEQKQPQTSLCLPIPPVTEQPPHTQTQQHQQLMLQEQQEAQPMQHPASMVTTSADLLEIISTETSAAVSLQSLNTSHSPNALKTPPASGNVETQLQSTQIQQQPLVVVPATDATAEQLKQPLQQQNHSSDNIVASVASTPPTSVTSSPQQPQSQLQEQQQQQQHKSPQKNNQSQQNSSHPGRKTPGKHARATSFSEDNEQNHNEDNSVTPNPTSSTPKEKPKLSREDRKMEAILRAIEKMERSQQRKQEQKQTKRQNAGSHNTTPTSPNKTDSSENTTGGTKRSNNQAGATGRSKKKRKVGTKAGQGSNQRKRRQSRMNSQESVDECNNHDQDAVTSESDGCTAMLSPPIQTIASLTQPQFSTPTSSSMAGCITTSAKLTTETTNNVDQAAGLLMAFANPDINSPDINSSSVESDEQHIQQSPHRSSSQYMISTSETAASPPPTPPSQVSSACLLIEAAVGPLESNLNGNNAETNNAEFKYPLQAKTKKHLMNNWFHQTEDNSPDNEVTALPELNSQSLQTPVTSVASTSVATVSVVSGGLDSLLQAAMSDLKQSQNDTEEPQNLSIAAQKVEEFIQQTEASACGPQTQPQTKHSYEYELHKQHQRTYATLPTPAVDLTLKTPLTIGPNPSSEITNSNNRNFHLPLQVSTCSNNSSVKKRWLRQAISEETYEEFQQTPSPTAVIVNNNFSNSQLQPTISCSPATIINYVPNGFTTPLKKRRLLLTGKDEADENLSHSCGDFCANTTPSPPPVLVQKHQQQIQMQFDTLQQNQPVLQELENKEMVQDLSSRDIHEDVDVDVEKCEINETRMQQIQEGTQDLKYTQVEMNQEQDVDVTTSPQDAPHFQSQTKTVIKHENDVAYAEAKESLETSTKQTDQSCLAEFNDQEDDVDILRSPSPGREMIKAEDNLVKIEPEDVSGMEDVKIDVEREESMAADDDVVTQHKERKQDITSKLYKKDENDEQAFSKSVEIKKEFKINEKEENAEQKQSSDTDIDVVKSKADRREDLCIKTEHNESHTEYEEPKPKRLKLEKSETGEKKLGSVEKALTKEESISADEIGMKPDRCTTTKVSQKQQIVRHCSNKDDEKVLKTDLARKEKQPVTSDVAEVTSSEYSTLLASNSSPAHTTFADVEPSTPPLPLTVSISVGTVAPIQRHKSLSDDDIQARLHSFHKENILFLQSRNKKTKSSSSLTTSNTNRNSSSTNDLINNNDHKNRTSSSSTNHQHHHNHHHHHHDGKEKSDKSSLKHRKSSSAAPSGTSKKQKLHKRERTTSSSSPNSHKNSTSLHTTSSSLLNKNAVISSTSSGSSKKLKSLKKSSSGSSTSSLSSYSSSTLALQNCYQSSSSAIANISCLNSDKERIVGKDKQHRQRTTSTSSGNNNASSSSFQVTPTAPYHLSKKRQLNFELELTKDMHLLNSVITGGSKHKRETSRLLSDEQIHVTAKKSRKEATLLQKEEFKSATNSKLAKIEKQQDKKCTVSNVGSAPTKQSAIFSISANSQPIITSVSNTSPTSMPTEEPKPIPTIVSQPSQPLLTLTPILREHPTLPHFNNVIVATSSPLANHLQPPQSPLTPVQSQPPTPILPQNIPSHVNSPNFISPVHSNHNSQLQQPPLPPTPPPAGGVSSPSSTPNVNSASHLPFYNTIYGKLLDNSAPLPSLPTPLTPSITTTTPPPPIPSASVATASGVLSEYLDTKLKSYNTLGGYVSHTALFGLNNAVVIKDTPASTAVVSSSTITVGLVTTQIKDSSIEMPAPLPPSSTVSGSTTTSPSSSGNSAATITPLKIHTKTASHDPRLNPQLTAPEPPPQPKRKLSINEYRKRMQQYSSNDSNSGNGSLTTTPTTPPSSIDSMSSTLLGSMTMPLRNKCTLNSPDHLTQSVDSQIQKEIMSTTSAVSSSSSSSSLDSLNSSNSSTSLNDTLLKSSSFVEEDSTKGQFNAAPTLLEKQQESLCARLKSLKEKQSLGTAFSVASGNRSRFSSFSESVASSEFGLRKEDDIDIIRNRNLSMTSSIGGGDLLDNCLEEISSTSTSMSSSRETSPERCYTTHHKILTASATTTATTMTSTSPINHSNNRQTSRQHQQHHHQINTSCDKNEIVSLERKKSVDTA